MLVLPVCAAIGWTVSVWTSKGIAAAGSKPLLAAKNSPQTLGNKGGFSHNAVWLERVENCKAADLPGMAEEATKEENPLTRGERLMAVFSRWVEVDPRGGWEWVYRKFPDGSSRERSAFSEDSRLSYLLTWSAVDGPAAYAAAAGSGAHLSKSWLEAIAARWAALDARALLTFVESGGWPMEGEKSLRHGLEALAATDPAGAYERAAKLTDRADRTAVVVKAANAMALKDPEAALAWVREIPSATASRTLAYGSVFKVMAASDPAKAARLMDEELKGPFAGAKEMVSRGLLREWMKTDTEAAVKWGLTLGPDAAMNGLDGLIRADSPQASVVMGALKTKENQDIWENTLSRTWDAGTAEAWLTGHGSSAGGEESLTARTAMSAWARENPTAAAAWIDNLPAGKDQEMYRDVLMAGMARNGAPDAQVLEQLGKLKSVPEDSAVREMVSSMGAERPADVLKAISGMAAGTGREAWLAETAGRWAERDPASAASWTDQLPEMDTRRAVVESVAKTWWPDDPAAAEAWAARQPEGAVKDAAFSALSRTMLEEAPDRSFSWAAAIADEGIRIKQLTTVVEKWIDSDPVAARAAVGASTLTQPEKDRLMERSPSSRP